MLVYISGKITGKENYKDDFLKAEQWLKLNDYKVVNPSRLIEIFPSLEYAQLMAIDYKLIDMCDAIFMLDGWQKSKGACAELSYAKSLGKKVKYQDKYKDFKRKGD
jgi:nucleoside 2-deoxyribosyltransferase